MNDCIIKNFEVIDDVQSCTMETVEDSFIVASRQFADLAEGLALILGLVNVNTIKAHCSKHQAHCLDMAVEHINGLSNKHAQMRN